VWPWTQDKRLAPRAPVGFLGIRRQRAPDKEWAVDFVVGTSGYSYKEWKGPFYPEDLPAGEMLRYYGERLNGVEINNTFYRMPKASVLEGWSAQVPESFRFSIKASQKITHHKRLKEAHDEVEYLVRTVRTLGEKLGVLLFQLPPNLKKDMERISAFLKLLPRDVPVAFEFRHESWHDDEVIEALRGHGAALCCADTEEDEGDAPLVATAGWGYLRLRRPTYELADLERWVARIGEQPWERVFVFFKHEDAGAGPRMAAAFRKVAGD
jgi:uncharacterized protein YecE (DUF72 family)